MKNCLSQCLEYITGAPQAHRDAIYDEKLKPNGWKLRLIALGKKVGWRVYYGTYAKQNRRKELIVFYKSENKYGHAVVESGWEIVFNPGSVKLGKKSGGCVFCERK